LARAPDRSAGDHRCVGVDGVAAGTNVPAPRYQVEFSGAGGCATRPSSFEKPRSPTPGFFFAPRSYNKAANNKAATRALHRVAALTTVSFAQDSVAVISTAERRTTFRRAANFR